MKQTLFALLIFTNLNAQANTKLTTAIQYVLTAYSSDVPASAALGEEIDAADAVCSINQDVADEELDNACAIINDEI